jgi:translation initiation factor IF-3
MALWIGDHDFDISRRRAAEFLGEGDKVKVLVRFRGRETERPEFGLRLLDRFSEALAEVGTVEQTPNMEGRVMTMVIAPNRRHRLEQEEEPAEG